MIGLLAWGYARGRQAATIIESEQLTVRRTFGTRAVQWPDIQAIEVETQPVWTAQARQLRNTAVVYDGRGHRTALPGLDEAHVASLDDEVRDLQALRERRRGEQWEPAAGTTGAIDQAPRGTQRRGSGLLGALVGLGLLFCIGVIVLVVVTDGPITALVLFGLLPVVAGAATFVILLNRQKQASQAVDDGPPPDPSTATGRSR